jgi:hypothetical protein
MTADRSPDEWDASDHIDNLKAGIPKPGSKISGICDHHSALALALIWMIRRMDKDDRGFNLRVLLPAGGAGAGVIAVIEVLKVLVT